MAITCEYTLDVTKAPETAFATLDDLAKTPQWLSRCVGIETLSPGPLAVGTRLRYRYKEGRRVGEMEGEITARTPHSLLGYHYTDRMMDVVIGFQISKTGGGAKIYHTIAITPRNLLAKLFSPLIRRQLPKQTAKDMATLRKLIEA